MSDINVLVIGSGVAGASTAFALARRGANVRIADADCNGMATNAGAGIIQPWSKDASGPFYDLYAAGAAHYPVLIDELRNAGVEDIGFRRSGALIVNQDPAELDVVQQRVASRARVSPDVGAIERLGNDEARALFPPLAEDLQALFISGGARVDGRSLRAGLLKGAAYYKAQVVSGVCRLLKSGEGSAPRAQVGDDVVEADAIVVAAGAWTNQLLEPLGTKLSLNPQRGQITHLRVDSDETSQWPSVHPMTSHYMVAFDDSRVVVGTTRETGSGFAPRVTAGGQLHILDAALSVAPGLANASFLETRVGLRPLSDDEFPFLGALDDTPGVFVNAGFGAVGLTMGPYVGELIADQVLGHAGPFDLSAFRVQREHANSN